MAGPFSKSAIEVTAPRHAACARAGARRIRATARNFDILRSYCHPTPVGTNPKLPVMEGQVPAPGELHNTAYPSNFERPGSVRSSTAYPSSFGAFMFGVNVIIAVSKLSIALLAVKVPPIEAAVVWILNSERRTLLTFCSERYPVPQVIVPVPALPSLLTVPATISSPSARGVCEPEEIASVPVPGVVWVCATCLSRTSAAKDEYSSPKIKARVAAELKVAVNVLAPAVT